MFLPYRIIGMLGLVAALANAWSVAPLEGPAVVDTEVVKLVQGLRTRTEKSVSNVAELEAALADPSFDAIVCVSYVSAGSDPGGPGMDDCPPSHPLTKLS